jgi:hypothetical protein
MFLYQMCQVIAQLFNASTQTLIVSIVVTGSSRQPDSGLLHGPNSAVSGPYWSGPKQAKIPPAHGQ